MAIPIEKFIALRDKYKIALDAPIEEHAQVILPFYLEPYSDGTVRVVHDVKHVSRAAAYVLALVNYRRNHNDPLVAKLSGEHKDPLIANLSDENIIKIAQLMAFWHDSGREGEGEDIWDKDSAINLYNGMISPRLAARTL